MVDSGDFIMMLLIAITIFILILCCLHIPYFGWGLLSIILAMFIKSL